MKRLGVALAFLAAALPFGLLVLLVIVSGDLWLQTSLKRKVGDVASDGVDQDGNPLNGTADDLVTDQPKLNGLRFPIIAGVLKAGLSDPFSVRDLARGLIIVAGTERSFDGAVGDLDPVAAPGGPSISPWQIERVNAIRYGWYSTPDGVTPDSAEDRAAYAAIVTTGLGLWEWAAHAAEFFLKECWRPAQGDLMTALGIWNGGPNWASKPNAERYAEKGLAFAKAQDWA
jgi:hypothetical protein